jgi:hypothetical protein
MVAIVDAQPAAGAVLAGLRHVRAQLVDDEPHAAGGDAGDPLPGLGVRGLVVVGAEQPVDELCRRGDYADMVARSGREPSVAEGFSTASEAGVSA